MNYYSVERSTDHLAHYGVRGMKWGVRKAVARRDAKALDRHYKKAAKKLAKLQDIGLNSKKYAAKAAAYGAAAAGTGTLAVAGQIDRGTLDFGSLPSLLHKNKKYKLPKIRIPNTKATRVLKSVSGAATVGLAGAAGLNAYRAANGRKYRAKAYNWKNTMDEAFKGTKYEGKYAVPEKKKKKKKVK